MDLTLLSNGNYVITCLATFINQIPAMLGNFSQSRGNWDATEEYFPCKHVPLTSFHTLKEIQMFRPHTKLSHIELLMACCPNRPFLACTVLISRWARSLCSFELYLEKCSTRSFEIFKGTSRPPSLWSDFTAGFRWLQAVNILSPVNNCKLHSAVQPWALLQQESPRALTQLTFSYISFPPCLFKLPS